MRIAIVGASGKTGRKLVRESLKRGYEVAAVCRDQSVHKLTEFDGRDDVTLFSAPIISDEALLTEALAGADAVVGVLVSLFRLKATKLVRSLAKATAANGVRRLVFTAGEVTAMAEPGETYTLRQRIMITLIPPLLEYITPISVRDMLKASQMVAQQANWDWTIFRAPTLTEGPAEGYRLCEISDVTGKHKLSREDYAACMLDSITNPQHHGRTLTVVADE